MKAGFVVLQKCLMAPMAKISQLKIVRAVMAAGMAVVPFTIVGSMFLVFNILPMTFPGLQGVFEETVFKISDLYMVANTATMAILALYFNLVVGYELTRIESEENGLNVDPLNGALLSLFAFFMTLPELVMQNGVMSLIHTPGENIIHGLRMESIIVRLGSSGIFIAIVMSVLATQMYFLCVRRNWIIKMPETVPLGVSRSFTSLIPTFVIAFAVIIINGILVYFGTDLYSIIGIPFTFVTRLTQSWLGLMVIVFLIHALWIVGIHGATIIVALTRPFTLSNMTENIMGAHIPFAGEFNNAFITIGGSGTTLLMTFFITFFAKSIQLRILGRASIVPSIFNINEPIIFGTPIVYNPYMAIPFIVAPMLCASLGYFAISTGFINPVVLLTPWPSPVGVGAFISTGGDYKSVFVAIAAVVLALIVYLPFLKIYDNKLCREEQISAEKKAAAV